MSAPYAECDLAAIVENVTVPAAMPHLVEMFVHGFMDAILDFNPSTGGGNPASTPEPSVESIPPAAFEGLSSGAGSPAESASLPLSAHSAGVQA